MASCDAVRTLATIKAQCGALPEASRGDELADVEASWKAWSKLRGQKKTAQGKACTRRRDALRVEVAACASTGSLATTGLSACDDYIAAIERFIRCDKVPQMSRDATRQGLEGLKQGWGDVRGMAEEARQAANDACRQATDALRQGATAMGCPM